MLWDMLDDAEQLEVSASSDAQSSAQEEGIASLRAAHAVYTLEEYPEQYARVCLYLGLAYRKRITGVYQDNLEQAIGAFQEALRVYTQEAYPQEYASTQVNLGGALQERIAGSLRTNLDQAIACYRAALEVYTLEASPLDYALTQHNLGEAYSDRIDGDPRENNDLAVACFTRALDVYTLDDHPLDRAAALMGIGNALLHRMTGSPRDNIEQAIITYEQALQLVTHETSPVEYGNLQHNLGNAYVSRISGSWQENQERALSHFQEALHVFPRDRFPTQYARALVGLADIYEQRGNGERAENQERAIQLYEEALTIYTLDTNPQGYARVQHNLGIALVRGQGAIDNFEDYLARAVACFEEALRVYKRDEHPFDYALAQSNLGAALAVAPRPGEGHTSVSERFERAIICLEKALSVYTFEQTPTEYAGAAFSMGNVYTDRIVGERQDNIARAKLWYQEALRVFTPDAFPRDARDTYLNLAWLAYNEQVADARQRDDHAGVLAAYAEAHRAYYQARRLQSELGWLESNERGRVLLSGLHRSTRDLYARDAWCLIRLGDLHGAAQALEAGRAQALAESHAVTGADLSGVCASHEADFVEARRQLAEARRLDGGITHRAFSTEPESSPSHTTATRTARDTFLRIRTAIRAHCHADFLPGEPDDLEILSAAAPNQALVYLVAADRGAGALVVLPEHLRRPDDTLAFIPLPLLTWQTVDDWLLRPDEEGWIIGGFRLALEGGLGDLLRAWISRPQDDEGRQWRQMLPVHALAHALPVSMGTIREAFARLVRSFEDAIQQGEHGSPQAQARAETLRSQLASPLADALGDAMLMRKLHWYFQETELEHLLPELSTIMMQPLREGLTALGLGTPDQALAFIACGRLGALPLHAAVVADPQSGRLRPFQETCELTYQASARSLAESRAKCTGLPVSGPFLIVGDPQPTSAKALPFAAREALALADRARRAGRGSSRAVVKNEATLARVRALLVANGNRQIGAWVEIASHGHADARDAERCYVLLGHNKRLTLGDLQRERLLEGVRCFIASGCVTALGDLEQAPDELSSFAAGALQAGAAATIATQWSVSDLATARLMLRFGELALEHLDWTPARSLREATTWLRTMASDKAYPILRSSQVDEEQPQRGVFTYELDNETIPLQGFERSMSISPGKRDELLLADGLSSHGLGHDNPQGTPDAERSGYASAGMYAHPIYWASVVIFGA
jgi:CHAT domain-containing protein/tetratricopeptide (TPR) repeat protein